MSRRAESPRLVCGLLSRIKAALRQEGGSRVRVRVHQGGAQTRGGISCVCARGKAQGLSEEANFHEFCRLLSRIKSNFQLSEMVKCEVRV